METYTDTRSVESPRTAMDIQDAFYTHDPDMRERIRNHFADGLVWFSTAHGGRLVEGPRTLHWENNDGYKARVEGSTLTITKGRRIVLRRTYEDKGVYVSTTAAAIAHVYRALCDLAEQPEGRRMNYDDANAYLSRKRRYRFAWMDPAGNAGPMPRSRVAYLVRAARSRGKTELRRRAIAPWSGQKAPGKAYAYVIGRLHIYPIS